MRRILVLSLFVAFVLPVYADKVLFMRPVTKEIERSDAAKIVRDLESVVTERINSVSYKDLSKGKIASLQKCGMKTDCWYDNASDEDFQYALLTLISMNEDEEVIIRFVFINIEYEEIIDDSSMTYDYVDSVTKSELFKQLRKTTSSVFNDIKSGTGSRKSAKRDSRKGSSSARDEEDEIASRRDREREAKAKADDERRRREEERKNRLEEERRQRELEIQKKREEEERREKELERKRRIDEERKRREEEAERERLEKERERREGERRREQESKRKTLTDNAEKLSRARELVLEMCSQGKYNAAIKAIIKVSELKCECEEDAKVLALKTQLLNFNKMRDKILEGVKLLDYSLILDNLEAAKALDEYIVPGGTEFSKRIDKIEAIGYMAKGRDMEKKDNYILANEAFQKCADLDPDKTECSEWLNSKDKLVKRVYDKATVMKNFNPTKAKELLRSILKLVTADNEHYKKAEEDLKKLEY